MNDFFDNIYLINLDRRPDRLEGARKELRKHGIRYTRVAAVDGKTLNPEDVRDFDSSPDQAAVCAVGLTLMGIFKEALSKNYDRILILEDDVELYNLHYFKEAVKSLPDTFDLLYLGAQHKQEPEPFAKNLVKIKESYLCHAVGFGRNAMEYLQWALMEDSNEGIYSKIQSFRKNSFCVSPNIAFQTRDLSDISGMVANYDEILEKKKSLSI